MNCFFQLPDPKGRGQGCTPRGSKFFDFRAIFGKDLATNLGFGPHLRTFLDAPLIGEGMIDSGVHEYFTMQFQQCLISPFNEPSIFNRNYAC